MQPELLLDAHADLGEGPAWDAGRNCLYWVDIHAGDLHIFHPEEGTDTRINLGETVGCVAPCQSGDLVIALRGGFASLNLTTQKLTRLATLEQHLPGNRFNDGKCDPAGRFLAGTMDDAEKEASGSLYSFSPNGSLKTLLTGIRISNGLTWSPDHKTFYHIDTPTRQITAFDYDLATGEIDNPRIGDRNPSRNGLAGWNDLRFRRDVMGGDVGRCQNHQVESDHRSTAGDDPSSGVECHFLYFRGTRPDRSLHYLGAKRGELQSS